MMESVVNLYKRLRKIAVNFLRRPKENDEVFRGRIVRASISGVLHVVPMFMALCALALFLNTLAFITKSTVWFTSIYSVFAVLASLGAYFFLLYKLCEFVAGRAAISARSVIRSQIQAHTQHEQAQKAKKIRDQLLLHAGVSQEVPPDIPKM